MAIQEMLRSHGDDVQAKRLSAVIEAALECAAHCDACADACLDEDADMTRCIRSDMDCADICRATAAVLSRPGADGMPWIELVEVCMKACRTCADECGQHDHEHCQLCAEACRRCEEACRELLESVR